MENDYKNNKFIKLLEKLQQESWQLELLISGFAIFGLFSSLEPLNNLYYESVSNESYSKFLYLVAGLSCKVLIVNLVLHVVLRGLWIGAIGLRYVSNDIDYEALKYKPRFTNYLEKKVGSFDRYIGNLENYCSILFAITFLYLFYIISFFLTLFILFLAGLFFLESGLFSSFLGTAFLGFFAIIYTSLMLIVFIDFVTQGWLKKIEWTSFLYLPLYKVFSVITLSFLYRPLVYNFLDNKFGRRLLFVLFPIYLFGFYISTVDHVRSNYITYQQTPSKNIIKKYNYLENLTANTYVKDAAIQSKIIKDSYITLFLPLKKNTEDAVFLKNEALVPENDNRGFVSRFFSSTISSVKKDSLQAVYLNTIKTVYDIRLNGVKQQLDFKVTTINNQTGFESNFSTKTLKEGPHNLSIKKIIINKFNNKSDIKTIAEIPFWVFKNNE